MGEFFLDSEQVRVEFPDGNWVAVKEELTQEDQDYLLNAMAQTKGGMNPEITFSLGRLALLERAVIAWSFSQPVNRENLSRLRRKYREKVLNEIDRLNAEAEEYLKKK